MSRTDDFISIMAPVIQKVSQDRGYKICSVTIAQAVIESASGTSDLAIKHNNFFGMKAGSSWQGKTADYRTAENKPSGEVYYVTARFRHYDTLLEGVNGYYDFISAPRYNNLKNAKTAGDFASDLKADGYATAVSYVSALMNIVNRYHLTKYDGCAKIKEINTGKGGDTKLKKDEALTVLAKLVINGQYGRGEDRKERLYKDVQDKVNEILKNKKKGG